MVYFKFFPFKNLHQSTIFFLICFECSFYNYNVTFSEKIKELERKKKRLKLRFKHYFKSEQ